MGSKKELLRLELHEILETQIENAKVRVAIPIARHVKGLVQELA